MSQPKLQSETINGLDDSTINQALNGLRNNGYKTAIVIFDFQNEGEGGGNDSPMFYSIVATRQIDE